MVSEWTFMVKAITNWNTIFKIGKGDSWLGVELWKQDISVESADWFAY